QQQLWIESDYEQRSYIELDYEQHLYIENLEVVQDELHLYQAPEYSGGLGEGAAYRLPYSQDESTDEGRYEHPQYMRSYTSMVTQPMLPAWAEYAQYVHPVDENQQDSLSLTAAFLWDDLAIMVVEGLLDQIELMRRQCVSALEQIERIGKRKAPAFEELMVEPKRARAPSQHPQELVWAPAHTVAWLLLRPLKLASGASTSRSIMSDALAVQQEQRSEAPQVPVASSSKAEASSQGEA
ncbi:hypothetical protein C0995_015578, partial [Termitomyces sp. Mi166